MKHFVSALLLTSALQAQADIIRVSIESYQANACQEHGYPSTWNHLRAITLDFNLKIALGGQVPGCDGGQLPFVASMVMEGAPEDIERLKNSGRLEYRGNVLNETFKVSKLLSRSRGYHLGSSSSPNWIYDIFTFNSDSPSSDEGLFSALCGSGEASAIAALQNSPKRDEAVAYLTQHRHSYLIGVTNRMTFDDGHVAKDGSPYICTWTTGPRR